MSKTITSSNITFLDRTDERKLDVYITSNHPSVQIYNGGTGMYTPDWGTANLQLSAKIYLNAQDVTSNYQTSIRWYTKVGEAETLVQTGSSLNVSSNILSATTPILTYVCRATYQGISAMSQTMFARVDTGLNGASAPAVVAQYSANGTTGWTSTLNTATHKYVRYSYDGGTTYTVAIKMVGEDGTSVVIKGTAYTPDTLTTGAEVLLYSDESHTSAIVTSTLSTGDSYLVDGYLCVYNKDSDKFVCAGTIQGPTGQDGQSSYVFIRYATDASGTGMSTSPVGKTYLGIYTSNTNVPPTLASSYTWCKFVGDGAQSISLSGSSQVFKINKEGVYSPSIIKVTANAINTSVVAWIYSTDGGQTFTTTAPGGISRSGNVVSVDGAELSSTSIVIKALNNTVDSDNAIKDVFTIYKAFDGGDGMHGADGKPAPIVFLTNENISFAANNAGVVVNASTLQLTTNVVSYIGTDKQMPVIGDIMNIPAGMNIAVSDDATLQEKCLTISFDKDTILGSVDSDSGTITIPVTSPATTNLKLSWSKINAGADGVAGAPGSNAVTFQIYSSNGYALSMNTPTITLQTFAYVGDVEIAAGATYQWYSYYDTWSAISGETAPYMDVSRDDVSFSKSYMCKMNFDGVEYTSVVTIDDKNDTNKVFSIKPSNYTVGDIWIVGTDYTPSGVEVGSLLKAQYTNAAYQDSDWITATKYDEKINELQDNLAVYDQYFSFDSADGLRISARDKNGSASKFSTSLTNERLSFNYGDDAIAYINGTKMNIKEAVIESPLTVTGKYSGSTMLQAPIINIGNFSIVVESNGSLSIIANT